MKKVGDFFLKVTHATPYPTQQANRRAPVRGARRGRRVTHKALRQFSSDDPRRHLAVKDPDNRVHFALLRLTSDELPAESEADEPCGVGSRKLAANTSFSLPARHETPSQHSIPESKNTISPRKEAGSSTAKTRDTLTLDSSHAETEDRYDTKEERITQCEKIPDKSEIKTKGAP